MYSKGETRIEEEAGMILRSEWDNNYTDININEDGALKAENIMQVYDVAAKVYNTFERADISFIPSAGAEPADAYSWGALSAKLSAKGDF